MMKVTVGTTKKFLLSKSLLIIKLFQTIINRISTIYLNNSFTRTQSCDKTILHSPLVESMSNLNIINNKLTHFKQIK